MSRLLDHASPQEILRWAVDTFPGLTVMTSSFQTQSMPLLHMVANTVPELPILFIDTGYHFPETLALRDTLIGKWKLRVMVVAGHECSENPAATNSRPLHQTDPELCCRLNKVEPMQRAMQYFRCWISGIRRDQTTERADIRIVESTSGIHVRIHPMANWTQADVDRYILEHDLPQHPLTIAGYTSIGCAPCTALPLVEDDLRSGRWVGKDKRECGLHTTLRPRAKSPPDR